MAMACLPILVIFSLLLLSNTALLSSSTSDTDALSAFRALVDAHGYLASNWTGPDACSSRWVGVGCSGRSARVTSLSLPSLNLRGPLGPALSPLDQLKLLDLSRNRLNGTLSPGSLPPSLKLLYLSANDFSGRIPMAIARLPLLARLDLSDNNLDGPVPAAALASLTRLLTLLLQDNLLSGPLPDLSASLPRLAHFNASNNQLYGMVPNGVLARFGAGAVAGNAGLCGSTPPLPVCSSVVPPHIDNPPNSSSSSSVVPSNPSSSMPASNTSTITSTEELGRGDEADGGGRGRTRAIVGIAVGNAVFLLLLLSLVLAYCYCSQHFGRKDRIGRVQVLEQDGIDTFEDGDGRVVYRRSSANSFSLQNKMDKKKKKKWIKDKNHGESNDDDGDATEEEQSKLVFFEEDSSTDRHCDNSSSTDSGGSSSRRRRRTARRRQFGLEELLRASAEMLGKGSLGTVYRAVLEDGSMVAVKRLKDANPCRRRDFHKYMDLVGRLRHPNLVQLKAYYFAKQEKLLIYDYLSNGSLYSLLHGNRGTGRVPLDWTTRVSLVLGAARGLAHIHEEYSSARIPHGNVKSANVLLDRNGAACIADFGLSLLLSPLHAVARLGGYMAPEQQADGKQLLSQEADVYCFGVLILEVLTGRAPAQYPPPKKNDKEGRSLVGVNLVEWVKSVVSEEWTAEVFDTELLRYKNIQEEMVAMLHVGLACVVQQPDRRPVMVEVVRMIEDIKVEQSPLPEDMEDSRTSLSPSLPTTNTEDGLPSS